MAITFSLATPGCSTVLGLHERPSQDLLAGKEFMQSAMEGELSTVRDEAWLLIFKGAFEALWLQMSRKQSTLLTLFI